MPALAVIGTQWGDEGKGKLIDFLAQSADWVVRYQGGPNAGHTVKVGTRQSIFHQVPSGILNPKATCAIGAGCVVDPRVLCDEIAAVEKQGVPIAGRLLLATEAHLIMPYHRALDELRETARGAQLIGTTRRGVGPCYEDKYARVGIRAGDLADDDLLSEKLRRTIAQRNFLLMELYKAEPLSDRRVLREYQSYARRLVPALADVGRAVRAALGAGKRVLFEGAQGVFLDIDHGTYPFVTSSYPGVSGIPSGVGVPCRAVERVLGIAKAYTTRVGRGPFPTEETTGPVAEILRQRGGEFGATTGRARRCGWFDAPLVRRAVELNGVDALAVTKLDVLDDFPRIKVGIGYDGSDEFDPGRAEVLKPRYIELDGWQQSTRGARTLGDLPKAARAYLARIEEAVGVPIAIVSVDAERAATIVDRRFKPF